MPLSLLEGTGWTTFDFGMWANYIEFAGTGMTASRVNHEEMYSVYSTFTAVGQTNTGVWFEHVPLATLEPEKVNRMNIYWGAVNDIDFASSSYLSVTLEIQNNGFQVFRNSYDVPGTLDYDLESFDLNGLTNYGSKE